ncbi:MAG: carbamoyltransferase [bacterium]|nr:carbamoyltransferase [bacterium]
MAKKSDSVYILGISAYYHDSAACLLRDGEIFAAAQEERFTRKKHDHRFPTHAVAYCLQEAGIQPKDLKLVAFYDKPLIKFERLLETYLAYAPKGFPSFLMAMPLWLKQKLFMRKTLALELGYEGEVIFPEHHESHAASAFFPSPFQDAAILTLDGVGEWATTSMGVGHGNRLELTSEIHFPHSLGLLYSAFTYYTGFKVNSGEYKVMGLAPYGEPKYVDKILSELMDLKEDGSFKLDMKYFNYCAGLTMTSKAFDRLFDGPPRQPESSLTQKEMDLARSVQVVTEEVMLRMARTLFKETGLTKLCLAGGVALNCVGNGRLLREGPFKNLWIQPAAGDAGGALGAALVTWHHYLNKPRTLNGNRDLQKASLLGPKFEDAEIDGFLKEHGLPAKKLPMEDVPGEIAQLLEAGKVIGFFQGRMEYGPRALGSRSIIGDARNRQMQSVMNLKIKYRESFRPFAPTVMEEHASSIFEIDCPSPYMLLVANVRPERRIPMTAEQEKLFGIEKLNVIRSDIPAITHVDYSARLQTVNRDENAIYYDTIKAFYERTGCPVIINTSFNVRGEPIVCSPRDAYTCFMRTEMDYLIMGPFLLDKKDQPPLKEDIDWKKEFELD